MVSTSLLLGVLTGGLACSMVAFAHALVASGVSHFRIKLWEIHDRVVDDLKAGNLQNRDQANELLKAIRLTIFHAREFTFLRVFGGYALVRLAGKQDFFRDVSRKSVLEGVPDDALLTEHVESFGFMMSRYVYRTSLLGHVGMVALPVVWMLYSLLRGRTKQVRPAPEPERLATRPIRSEVKRELVLQAAEHPREMALAAC